MKVSIDSCKNSYVSSKQNLKPNDFIYKQKLIKGVQSRYQFTPSIDSLKSVLAPDELKNLLKIFKNENFSLGNFPFLENIKSGIHKINLHLHTRYSDGSLTVDEYLEQSRKYADKIAESDKTEIPFYVSAITDHNNVEAVIETIARIADEPKKYRNFKFVPGCEFMFMDKNSGFEFSAFEALGYCFNPFDKEFSEKLSQFNPIQLINKIKEFGGILSYAHPIRYCQGNGTNPDFINYLKKIGINGIESNYQYINFRKDSELSDMIVDVKKVAKENNFWETGGTDSHGRNIFHARVEKYLNELI